MKEAQEIINESGLGKEDYDELEYTYRAVESKFLDGMHEFEKEFKKGDYWQHCPRYIKIAYLNAQLQWMIAGRLLYRDGASFCSEYNIKYTYDNLMQLRGKK